MIDVLNRKIGWKSLQNELLKFSFELVLTVLYGYNVAVPNEILWTLNFKLKNSRNKE